MEIFGKDCHLVVRNETAALFDAQDGQVAALHAQELEPACKGGLGEPLTGAELLYLPECKPVSPGQTQNPPGALSFPLPFPALP